MGPRVDIVFIEEILISGDVSQVNAFTKEIVGTLLHQNGFVWDFVLE